ncbi:DUF4411 family protein [Haloferula sp. A504]|uniref:DUF4411 family protein n=1 Tax=Haloferula sp. A504 TaxID=3373601 RepID=UPI0031C6EDC3|nr:DUF4411 family protein [Verrucomicrobiaceae bacterium E54]
MAYLLDSNTLIEAKNAHYSFEVCPGFWDWLVLKIGEGSVLSIEAVSTELRRQTDELSEWAVRDASGMFLAPDAATAVAMREVTAWVMAQDYKEEHRANFFAKADPLLIACAKAHDHKVVTHEVPVPENSRKVKIPNVCQAMDVEWTNLYSMLRAERARFVLATD